MKTFSVILISAFIASSVSAQNFEITHELEPADVSGTIVYYSNLSADTTLTTYFSLINHSGNTQEVTVKRLKLDVPSSWQDGLSLYPVPDPDFQGTCYAASTMNTNPWTTLSSCTVANNEMARLAIDYFSLQEIGDGVYRYYFMNGQTPLDSVDVYLSRVLSTNELSDEYITVYPNPSKTIIHFDGATITTASIFDLNGKCVMNAWSVNNNELSIAGLTDGMYQIVIETALGIQTKKLVVHQ